MWRPKFSETTETIAGQNEAPAAAASSDTVDRERFQSAVEMTSGLSQPLVKDGFQADGQESVGPTMDSMTSIQSDGITRRYSTLAQSKGDITTKALFEANCGSFSLAKLGKELQAD